MQDTSSGTATPSASRIYHLNPRNNTNECHEGLKLNVFVLTGAVNWNLLKATTEMEKMKLNMAWTHVYKTYPKFKKWGYCIVWLTFKGEKWRNSNLDFLNYHLKKFEIVFQGFKFIPQNYKVQLYKVKMHQYFYNYSHYCWCDNNNKDN